MSDNGGNRIRVILRWIQVTDIHEAPGDMEGEFGSLIWDARIPGMIFSTWEIS